MLLKSKIHATTATAGVVATSRNNPISFENVNGRILAYFDSNQIGYIAVSTNNPVTFINDSGRVKMYVDNNFIGYITTSKT